MEKIIAPLSSSDEIKQAAQAATVVPPITVPTVQPPPLPAAAQPPAPAVAPTTPPAAVATFGSAVAPITPAADRSGPVAGDAAGQLPPANDLSHLYGASA